jgi:membrane associated rhomboid family serine protease
LGDAVLLVTGSDAPLYHYPITTLSLIAVNTLIHLTVSPLDPAVIMPWCLEYGNGLHPLQWISCNFLHIGWLHLVGNMFFLWPFGLLVEGKLGWWRMLLLCLAICVLHSSIQQVLMLSSSYGNEAAELSRQFAGNPEWEALSEDRKAEEIERLRQGLLENGYGRSLGASCLVFGLLAVCAVWAPVNEFDVISRWGSYERPVLTVAAVFIVKEFVGGFLVGGAISTPMLHLFGAFAGFALGIAMLSLGLVDCEGFDLISQVTGEKFQPWTVGELMPGKQNANATSEAVPGTAGGLQAAMPSWQVTKPQPQVAFTPGPLPSPQATTAAPSPESRDVPSQRFPTPDPLFAEPFASAVENRTAEAAVTGNSEAWFGEIDLPEPQTPEELMESAIALGDFSGALRHLLATIRADRGFKPSAPLIHRLAEGLAASQQTDAALKVLSFGITRYPEYADRWRFRSALIFWALKNAKDALRMASAVDPTKLSAKDRERLESLRRVANAAADSRQ